MEEVRDKITGQFLAGNGGGPGRPKGSRNKMTQRMLDRVAARQEDGLSMEEIMMDIAQDPKQPSELRFKAAAKVADLIYPRAASVEVTMDDENAMTPDQMDDRIKQLLALTQPEPKPE
ncbi:MAG: hypothetical protein ACRCXB_22075 [Aeromonadaceae bacterium]